MAKTQDALAANQDPKRKGLRVQRHFTTEGVHPYDQLTWELRDAVITNWRDGTTAFEQRGVEFPTTWSLNATNIVAQKYFRGPLGTPKRERSVKQMVDRVAGTIADWGIRDKYFASRADGEAFRAELTHILVNQIAAFNSPVWFNVGVEENPQSSACQPYDALVSTPTGMTRIGDLVTRNAVGTVVYDAHGETRVRAVKSNGDKQVFKVKLRNGSFIEATGDHLVYAVAERRTRGDWYRVDQLQPGMRLHLYPHRASQDDVVGKLSRNVSTARAAGGGTTTLVEPATTTRMESEAALAGWLQADGFVGQYDYGTNRSLTIEFMTVTDEEHVWVQQHLSAVFPDVHQHVREFTTVDPKLRGRRIRLYGEVLRPFVESWGLRARRHDLRVPTRLWNAPNEVVSAYLRSVFQAEGYVSVRGDGSGIHGKSKVAMAVISERWTEDLQLLLLRLGIYSRRLRKTEKRADRSDLFELSIGQRSERFTFAAEVGFLSEDKRIKLAAALSLDGKLCPDLREEEIVGIEDRGVQPVFDIQTDSGEYLSNNIRVHNCFILAVEDNLPSILNWYTEEGLIFKGGSGSGINLSTIRSSKELLSSGGQASGPVSFMRGADASAGTVKSGGKTRRAAKMVILNVDHPDVRDFIWCKAREEHKARVLREAGFDMDLDGPDSISIQYQNANNSVRVNDDFMRAYDNDQNFDLKAVLDNSTVETTRARDLMRDIAQAAWECADPGVQYDTTINDWHTLPESGRITASNPCSEYLSVDNSACNLASLNLLKFLRDDGSFEVEGFKHAVEIVFTAQEILVGNSSYPTKKIDKNTKAFRQLGLGYANLGALLMARGKGYDSDGGRAWAGAITALMTGHAYRTSAKIAEVTGPFDGYPKNRKAMLRVMGKHRAAVDGIDAGLVQPDLLEAARDSWDGALELGKEHGYRNAQASVLAPTGTISFLMDCDTTGIEPDLALIKYKKLVGGGSMAIVNHTVPRALRTLGYPEEHVQAVVDYVAEHNTVVGAPAMREEHYEVFDCAMGDSPIHYMGHLKMMAAAQPFISGSISKTVNVPESVTVEEVEQIYHEGWKLGLKAVAIYRDNCKVAQPLSATKSEATKDTVHTDSGAEIRIEQGPVRRRLPKTRPSTTTSFQVGDIEGYLTTGSYPDDGLGEIFVKVSKQGSTLSGVMDAFAIAVSIGLQYGVPLETYVSKFTNMIFEPNGLTDDSDVRMAQSIVDYVFRRLAIDHLDAETRQALGVRTTAERTATLNGQSVVAAPAPAPAGADVIQPAQLAAPRATGPEITAGMAADAPYCSTCGVRMRPAGSCYVCESCGTTSGCS